MIEYDSLHRIHLINTVYIIIVSVNLFETKQNTLLYIKLIHISLYEKYTHVTIYISSM